MSAAHKRQRDRDHAARLDARADDLRAQSKQTDVPGVRAQMLRDAARVSERADRIRMTLDRTEGRVVVSDHAVVRYLERRYGMDLDAIRAEIVPPAVASAVAALGGTAQIDVPAKHGPHTVVVKDLVVVTVYADSAAP